MSGGDMGSYKAARGALPPGDELPEDAIRRQRDGMTDTDTLREVLAEVEIERYRQDGLWGEQNHIPAVWLMILGEEVGEATKDALEALCLSNTSASGPKAWLRRYRTELIQVAAVAVAMVESLDRQELAGNRNE